MNKKTIFLSMIAMISAGCAVAMQPDAPTQETQGKSRPSLRIIIPTVRAQLVTKKRRNRSPRMRVVKYMEPLYSPETERRLTQERRKNQRLLDRLYWQVIPVKDMLANRFRPIWLDQYDEERDKLIAKNNKSRESMENIRLQKNILKLLRQSGIDPHQKVRTYYDE